MRYDDETLNAIYDKTSGYCHLCGKKLAFINYGRPGARGPWQVEHSVPRAKGGTDHLNNLFAACASCNRRKGVRTTQIARRWHGRTRAPLSVERRKEAKRGNALAGAVLGGLIGAAAGPWGAVAGAFVRGRIGYDQDPE
jgi:5-methylcytosine-specific restriction endonuclease McrA